MSGLGSDYTYLNNGKLSNHIYMYYSLFLLGTSEHCKIVLTNMGKL